MNRKTFAIRQFVAVSLALIAALFVIGHCAGCTPLTDADKAQIARDQVDLGVCATEAHMDKADDGGRNAKAWVTFDDCMTRHGFYDGGSDAR